MKIARFTLLAGVACSLLNGAAGHANVFFNLIPDTGTPQYVIDAFALAANRWSAVLADNLTVNLNIGFVSLPSGVIGQTSSSYVQQDYSAVVSALNASRTSSDDQAAYAKLQAGSSYSRLINRTTDNPNGANSATPYLQSMTPVSMTRANAKALHLLGSGTDADAVIRFSSSVAFDFNPSDGTTAGRYDFVTMAAHEIGHILGFVSVVDQVDQGTSAGAQLPATVLDLFRFSAASAANGLGVFDCTADTRDKFLSVDGGATFLTPFATGMVNGSGYQASHWKEFMWAGYLMDPALFPGIQRQITGTDLRAFDLLGYTLVGVPEPGTTALLVLGVLMAVRRKLHLRWPVQVNFNPPTRTEKERV